MKYKEIKPFRDFNSIMGFINYHMFWTGFVITRTQDKEANTRFYALRTIKSVFGHNDKSRIWT